MRKYNTDYRIVDFTNNVIVIQYSKVSWYGWKTRAIDITKLYNEPKYIQKYIKEYINEK